MTEEAPRTLTRMLREIVLLHIGEVLAPKTAEAIAAEIAVAQAGAIADWMGVRITTQLPPAQIQRPDGAKRDTMPQVRPTGLKPRGRPSKSLDRPAQPLAPVLVEEEEGAPISEPEDAAPAMQEEFGFGDPVPSPSTRAKLDGGS